MDLYHWAMGVFHWRLVVLTTAQWLHIILQKRSGRELIREKLSCNSNRWSCLENHENDFAKQTEKNTTHPQQQTIRSCCKENPWWGVRSVPSLGLVTAVEQEKSALQQHKRVTKPCSFQFPCSRPMSSSSVFLRPNHASCQISGARRFQESKDH